MITALLYSILALDQTLAAPNLVATLPFTTAELLHDLRATLTQLDVRGDMAHHRDHRYWEFVFEIEHPEIVLPDHVPALGLGPLGSLHDNLLRRTA